MDNEKIIESTINDEPVSVENTEVKEDDKKIVIELSKPYVFEGREYNKIDLSGLDGMTIKDAIDIQKQLFNEKQTAAMILAETSTAFARKVAAKASGLPIEFFRFMPRNISRAVQRTVMSYLNIDVTVENHVMTFAEPYIFEGKTYEDIDLTNIGELTSLNESEAENRMAAEGIMSMDATQNYFYNCVIASIATGRPEEFFERLPFKELLKFKIAVNDPAFFE